MKALKAAAALVLALGLAACAEEELPEPNPDPAPETPEAVISDERLDEILDEINDALVEADAESSFDEISDRITGPAVQIREAEYALSQITEDPVSDLATDSQLAIVAATDKWPRVVFVATSIPEDANLPLLLTLVQESPRTNYELWSWVRILPGVEMPQTVSAAVGSAPVAEDANSLVASPQEVLEQYVDLLNEGDDSDYADSFAEDSFREMVRSQASDLDDAVSDAGEAAMDASARTGDGVMALETYDGGAIVVGVISNDLRVEKTVARGTLEVGDVLAYGGDNEVTTEEPLTAHYLATIAFYVPPAGSDDAISVLGAEYVLADVTRGDDDDEEE